jgi:hypothetical protein
MEAVLMLTLVEKILFVVAVAASVYFAYVGFAKVYRVVMRGSGDKPTPGFMLRRLWEAAVKWIGTLPAWRTRRLSTLFHFGISAGFIFYFLVNFGDVIEGYFPITFLGRDTWIGNVYRLFSDIFTVTVLVGMIYFLLRRFVFNSPRLKYRDNIKLVEPVANGAIRRDSLSLCLHHVQPLSGCLPCLYHRQRAFALGVGGEQALFHQQAHGWVGCGFAQ